MNKAVVRLCGLGLVCLLGLAARPALAVPDIADFALGITREETLLRAAVPCGDKLCGEVAFGGRSWGGTFRFHADRLDAISLFGPPDDAYVEAAFQGFAESPYVVYRAVSDDAVFDFPSRAAEGLSPEQLDAAFLEFLRGLRGTGCTFASYFYTEPAVYEAMKREAEDTAAKAAAGGGGSADGKTAPDAAKQRLSTDGVVCNLTIDEEGIVIIIMARADLQAEMAARAAREAAGTARKGAAGRPERSSPAQKP